MFFSEKRFFGERVRLFIKLGRDQVEEPVVADKKVGVHAPLFYRRVVLLR